MTDEEMAAALRAKGWFVTEPSRVQGIQAGQVWRSPKPRTKARLIVQVNLGDWPEPRRITYANLDGPTHYVEKAHDFAGWVKRNDASPAQP